MFNFVKKILIDDRENDDFLYEFVLNEVENEFIIKGLWAKAIALSEGNDSKIKSLYMQYRVQNIKDQFSKLNIAYSDSKKEALFRKLKSGLYDLPFIDDSEKKSSNINTVVIEPKKPTFVSEKDMDDYADRRIREIEHDLKQYKK